MTDPDINTDFYELLKVPSTATEDEIRDALRLRRRHFTNRANNAADPVVRLEAQQTVKQLLLAERTLTDPEERRRYDAFRGFGGGRGQGGGGGFSPVPPFSPFSPNPPEGRPVPPPVPPPIQPVSPPVPPPAPPGYRPGPRGGPGTPAPTRLRWLRAHPKSTALIILGVLVVLFYSASHNSGATGGGRPAWPAGATRSVVLAPVVSALRSCAQAATASPANCPQQSTLGGQTIVWTLYGNPASGAQISFGGKRFTVLGHAIMTEQDTSSNSAPAVAVDRVGYDATVSWNSGHAALMSLGQLQTEPTPAITLPRPKVPDTAVKQAAAAAFRDCLASHQLALPPACPAEDFTGDAIGTPTNVVWHPKVNPLLNSRVTYDFSYGIFHVVGSYSITLTWQDNAGSQSQQDSGNYDAQFAYQKGRLRLLDISKA
jgi:DnaJ domain